MTFQSDDIFQLASTIWEAQLGFPVAHQSCSVNGYPTRSTAACVHISGGWNGAILLECPLNTAKRAASIMFGTDIEHVTTSDVQDAIAELANMVGGNMKALIPDVCHLSLPAVIEGGDYSARIPGSKLTNQVTFCCEEETVTISIFEKVGQSETAAA